MPIAAEAETWSFPQIIPVGKEIPPHPGDTLALGPRPVTVESGGLWYCGSWEPAPVISVPGDFVGHQWYCGGPSGTGTHLCEVG